MKIDIVGNEVIFDCGCRFEIRDKGPPIRIYHDLSYININFNCKATWDFLSTGNTKGIFQLESPFGQQLTKALKPENIEHLSALNSVSRPGCLEAKQDGKSLTYLYIDRKNGVEPVTYLNDSLEPVLSSTFGVLIYQEQQIAIAKEIAGFTLEEADQLRKSIGKKDAAKLAKLKSTFIDGCVKVGKVTKEQAETIFGWFEASARYLFNKSHAMSYAYNAYVSAYRKYHFNKPFFTSYLTYAKEKQKKYDEIKLLVTNAKSMKIDIIKPDINYLNKSYKRDPSIGGIRFGFTDIREVGESAYKELCQAIQTCQSSINKKVNELTWLEFLVHISQYVKSNSMRAIIESGALDGYKIDRLQMLYDFDKYSIINKREQTLIRQYINIAEKKNLIELVEAALKVPKLFTTPRIKIMQGIITSLKNPSFSLKDTPDWIARVEEARLGVSLSCSVIDGCKNVGQANTTCQEYIEGCGMEKGIFIACQIDSVKTHNDKNGNEMAFIKVMDSTDSIDCVCFSSDWEKIKKDGQCFEENLVMIAGERGKKGGAMILKNVWQLT